jgi:hypothetical protein
MIGPSVEFSPHLRRQRSHDPVRPRSGLSITHGVSCDGSCSRVSAGTSARARVVRTFRERPPRVLVPRRGGTRHDIRLLTQSIAAGARAPPSSRATPRDEHQATPLRASPHRSRSLRTDSCHTNLLVFIEPFAHGCSPGERDVSAVRPRSSCPTSASQRRELNREETTGGVVAVRHGCDPQ